MDSTFVKIKSIILDYEGNRIEPEKALMQINELSNTQVDREWLDSYWGAMDLDDFVRLISIPPIEKWRELTDEGSLELIREIIERADNAIVQRNTEALEKRYAKPDGTISDWIFQKGICDPDEILKRLKINTTIAL